MDVQIPVSIGELIDKITILEIKASRFQGEALAHVQRELELYEQVQHFKNDAKDSVSLPTDKTEGQQAAHGQGPEPRCTGSASQGWSWLFNLRVP